MHHGTLIATIVVGLVLAFGMGAVAHRLRLSPVVGYLMAGVVVGPFTPGFVADQGLADQLAEVGVILLMFGVGLHFSVGQLLAVRRIALPGAVVQIAVATVLGLGLARLLGWPVMGGIVFGLALSVASTVVLLRALQEQRLVDTDRGRIAVGWLIVEDLVMVVALVLLPALAGLAPDKGLPLGDLLFAVALTLGKVAAFVVVIMVVGRRLIPLLLHWAAHAGSRELFRLAVLSVALGVAYVASALFGVSFALGAFFAGMVLAESPLSQRAAEEALPFRDAFAVLFFVSVGMLFDPGILLEAPLELVATLAIILVGKSVAAFVIVRAFGRSSTTALLVAVSLAQIGEFSFILASLGVSLELLPETGRALILAGAIISILLNPLLFVVTEWLSPAGFAPVPQKSPASSVRPPPAEAEPLARTELEGHEVLVGYDRVGAMVAVGILGAGLPLLVVDDRDTAVDAARAAGAEALLGNATDPRVLEAANVAGARRLLVAIADGFEAGQVVEQARRINPALEIVARAHGDAEAVHLAGRGADATVTAEREIARAMLQVVPTAASAAG